MGKVSASETKRIITAIKRRDPLTDDPWSLFYRPHRRISSYLDGGSFGPSPDSPSWVLSRLNEPFGFLGCPFVELQVTALG